MAEQFVNDMQQDFRGGQDASKAPSRIAADSYSSGVNVSVANGVLSPRWGFTHRAVKPIPGILTNQGSNLKVPYEEIFHGGRFQALIPYRIGSNPYLIIVVSGVIYLLDILTLEATIMDVSLLNQNTERLNWSTAGKFTVIFDYPNFPVILDGNTARRADPSKDEVPVSTLGAYNQNRLFIANSGNEFTGGDPAGSLAAPDAPITFIEVLQIASVYFGQVFQLPTGVADGPITAMGFLEFVDSSTGIGPLWVATGNSIFTFNTQTLRANWENGTFGTAFVSTSGVAGQRAAVNVNADLFFLSPDGQVRTASMSRDEQKKWSRIPISREVQDWLVYSDSSLTSFAVLGYFNNKVFITANPYRVEGSDTNRNKLLDVAFGGFVVLELDNLATLGEDAKPAWAGLWTGINPMDMVKVGNRCFVMAKDASSNELYEILPETTYDVSGDTVRQVRSIVYTKEFDFEDPMQNKALHSMDLGIRNVKGDFKLQTFYKPNQGSYFAPWGEFKNKAPWRTCAIPQGCLVNGFSPHNYKSIVLGTPSSEACDFVGRTNFNQCRTVQLKFQIEGIYWELEEYRLRAIRLDQANSITVCDSYTDIALCVDCSTLDWAVEPFKSCQTQEAL